MKPRSRRLASWLQRLLIADTGRINDVVPRIRDYPIGRAR